jgi:hypothetical protein
MCIAKRVWVGRGGRTYARHEQETADTRTASSGIALFGRPRWTDQALMSGGWGGAALGKAASRHLQARSGGNAVVS